MWTNYLSNVKTYKGVCQRVRIEKVQNYKIGSMKTLQTKQFNTEYIIIVIIYLLDIKQNTNKLSVRDN